MKENFLLIYSFNKELKNTLSVCFVPGLVLGTASITTIGLNFENSRQSLAKYSKRRVTSAPPIRSPSYEVSHAVSSSHYPVSLRRATYVS